MGSGFYERLNQIICQGQMIFTSPSLRKWFGLRTGDTVEGEIKRLKMGSVILRC